ncbi:restriction endonuclease subunit S [Vibrio alginolyticus]|uniref:restriction endonuclease subunit S n=1 Tax=Vibrio sp. 1262-1 TaxID=3074548 RepID=UPI00040BA994|nr:restriction endonuclease subunit S [Vibrio sp. 1262-1]EJG0639401.1 restriction endonuclease subunit S [Vibrio parahaemolyticus]EJG0683905.1 restriction endonuclease subunit S [Vibrio parahaemolyticus]EJG0924566.1 restriction endonuclease subunit S [Vibrio parahaemolyticus]EJG1043767.1 restriction endonuclease subunit S [Vibrio parahaemolyticus]EJG1077196.1 restriction endonuclease subunit S [Vibrio parahaemolyticus]
MVPNGWKVLPLSSITKWSSGGTPSKNNPDYWNGEIPWISAASMRGHYFEKSELKITDLAVSNGAKMAPKDSLLLLVRGSMLWNKIPVGIAVKRVSFNQDVKCIVPLADELTTEFLLYWFLTYEHRLMSMVTGTGIGAGKLDTTDLQGLDVFLPPLSEQRKIAKILSTWDKAIATTEKLIETSKQQKKALMQQLLTGKKRLVNPETGKAFEGDWEEVKLKSCVQFLNGQRKPIKQEERANIQGIYPYYGATGIIDYVNNYIFDDEIILLGEDGENILSRVLPHVFVVRGKVWVNNHAHVLKANKSTDTDFLCMYLESLDYRKYNSGSAQPKINKAVCEKIPVRLPALIEQRKIASVLTAADKEIEVLEAKLVHLKQEKKALMQQLLTGKRRVTLE